MKFSQIFLLCFFATCLVPCSAQLELSPEIKIPELPNFKPLPAEDAEFDAQIEKLVVESRLDEITPAVNNPDGADEWSSIMVVDISDIENPRVAGWKQDNFIYPASCYKLYVCGELVRRVVNDELSLEKRTVVEKHNVRGGSKLTAGDKPTLSELMRLMMMYSDNTAANVAIDIAGREQASALLRGMDLQGSDITRKYLSRSLEDEGYADVVGTTSNAHHFATFLYAVETGAIGGGEGRGLIKGYMSSVQTGEGRMEAGLPDSATHYSKTGTWSIFSSQISIVEDGNLKYIICVFAPYHAEKANPRIARFTSKVHALLKES